MGNLLVSNIQRFSLHDGEGVRTTIFLMGCMLHCPWCANPENLTAEIKYADDIVYGQWYSCEDLLSEIKKDVWAYSKDGGVTFSGGEPLLWSEELQPLLKELNILNINVCFETSLFVEPNKLKIIIPFTKTFIVDIKDLTTHCLKNIGGDLSRYLDNLKLIEESKADFIFRIPFAKGITDTNDNIERIIRLISKSRVKQIEIFSIHNLAKEKYSKLSLQEPFSEGVDVNFLEKIKKQLNQLGKTCKINTL